MPILGHIATLTSHLDFACRPWPRWGRYRCATLLARCGAGTEMWAVIEALAADCQRPGETRVYELCQAHCPTLSEVI